MTAVFYVKYIVIIMHGVNNKVALITASKLSLSFGDRDIINDISFLVEKKNKIGLVGANGAGKTTLFKLITKEYSPSSGNITLGKDVTVGYMQQHPCSLGNVTMLDEAMSVFSFLFEIEDELKEIQKTISPEKENFAALAERQHFLNEQYERFGGLTYKSRTRSALIGLGFDERDFSLPCSSLSGGQRSKISLCKLLLSGADVLLLDEPTNHLDIKSVMWLENWLSEINTSFIVISHDRYFLDKVTNETFELERGHLFHAKRNYSGYCELKAERQKSLERDYENKMKEVKRIEGIIEQQKRFNQARNYVTIASKQKSIDRILDDIEVPEKELSGIRFNFTSDSVSGNDVLSVIDLSKSFDDKEIFKNVQLDIKKGERIFLIGENGCGKSTLLKMILGKIRRTGGRIITGVGVKIGYFDQSLALLSDDKTVLDEVWDDYTAMNETQIRSALAAFLFTNDDVYKVMNTLSGGEKARVALLKLMLSRPNFLILDEPTNHLDIKSREALEKAFDTYDGTMLIVSHDRYFINRLATRVIELKRDGAVSYKGNYDSYLGALEQIHDEEMPLYKEKKPKENSYRKKKEHESTIRKTKTKISRLEEEIDILDCEINSLQETLSSEDTTSDYEKILSVTNELDEKLKIQDEKMSLWQEANDTLEKLLSEDEQ